MVVLREKDSELLVPPPPYFAHCSNGLFDTAADDAGSNYSITPSQSVSRIASASNLRSAGHCAGPSSSSVLSCWRKSAPALPSHLLLLIVYETLPQPGEMRNGKGEEGYTVRTTRTLYWMAFCLRAVDRGFYLASMHVLRSTFLPYYTRLVRFSSDPFPHTSFPSEETRQGASNTSVSIRRSQHTESEVLDLYILHRLHEDVFTSDSSLHIERTDTLRDLFAFMQPRARLSDLVREYGWASGLVALSEHELENSKPKAMKVSAVSHITGNYSEPSDTASTTSRCTISAQSHSGVYDNRDMRQRSMSSLTLVPPGPPILRASRLTSPSQVKVYTNPHLYSLAKNGASTTTLPLSANLAPALTSSPPTSCSLTTRVGNPTKILYTALRISFTPRRVGLIYSPSRGTQKKEAPRTIVELVRIEDEPLESTASRLVSRLKIWMESGGLSS